MLQEHDDQRKRPMIPALSSRRWRVAMGCIAAALLLSLVLGTAEGRSLAADFLAQFRGERPESAALSTGQIANVEATLSELEHLGTVSGIDTPPAMRSIDNIAEASEFVGFDVLQPDAATLPVGIGDTPASIRVVPAHEARFTFDQVKARAYFQATGQGDVNLPGRFDGASLVVRTPPAVLLEYRNVGQATGAASGFGLLIGQAGLIIVDTDGGVTLDELSDFLLGLPGLSSETAGQLRVIHEWRTAVPLPIPVEQLLWERAMIAGSPGLLLNDNTGIGSAVIWQNNEHIYAIAGALKAEEIKHVAESLR